MFGIIIRGLEDIIDWNMFMNICMFWSPPIFYCLAISFCLVSLLLGIQNCT